MAEHAQGTPELCRTRGLASDKTTVLALTEDVRRIRPRNPASDATGRVNVEPGALAGGGCGGARSDCRRTRTSSSESHCGRCKGEARGGRGKSEPDPSVAMKSFGVDRSGDGEDAVLNGTGETARRR